METILPLLKKLLTLPGLSGYETPVRRVLAEAWQPYVDELTTSRLGSLHALRRGSGPAPRSSVLLAAHMDAIGMMVSGIEGEFLRITTVGGVDARVLPGQQVIVHGRREVPAYIIEPPAFLRPAGSGSGALAVTDLLADTGLAAAELARLVNPGDLISFDQDPLELGNRVLAGHSLDNRASLVALTACLVALHNQQLSWDVWAVATVQEEINFGGAYTSAFQLQPTIAVAIDTTFGAGPDSPPHLTFPIGKGLTLGWGPSVHLGLFEALRDLADRLEIPYELEVMPRNSGTDADSMQVVAQGLPTMVISIPIRNMHTAVEMVALADIERAGRLLAAFAGGLDDNFVERLRWDA